MTKLYGVIAVAIAIIALSLPPAVAAHCDTLAGPVVADARIALLTGDVTPVLKWVKPEDEVEVRGAFASTLQVRAQGPDARELADRYFFETLVRVHRRGEGAPYTGLKPAEAVEPIIVETDKAIAAGAADKLLATLQSELAEGIRQRFVRTLEAKKHANHSVAAGREYVEAYVSLTHYIEALHSTASGKGPDHETRLAEEHSH